MSAGIFLLVTLLLGGAGNSYPTIGAIIEGLSVALIFQLGAMGGLFRLRRAMVLPWAISVLALLLPLVQLLPLSPALWLRLPGHALPARLLSAAGVAPGWRPLSLDPALTEMTALELLPALALFWVALQLGERERLKLLYIVVGAAIASALLGAAQKTTGGDSVLLLFSSPQNQNAPGLFVNRNHQACFLLAAMPQLAAIVRLAPAMRRLGALERSTIFLALLGLLAAGAIATTSRMGLLMLLPATAVALAIGFGARRLHDYLFGGLAIAAAAAVLATQSSAFGVAFARLGVEEDDRTLFWAATRQAIARFWPMGSGIGTFPRVYPTVEQLDTLSKSFPYNAHDDYLELLLEGGAPALLLMLAAAMFLVLAVTKLIRRARPDASVAGLAAASSLVIVLFHSIVDYPLRMMSIMAMFGLLAGILAASTAAPRVGRASRAPQVDASGSPGRPRRRAVLLTSIAIAPCALFALYRIALLSGAQEAYMANEIPRAFALDGRWSDASATLALQRLKERRLVTARRLAERATADSPLDPQGPAALVMIDQAEKKEAAAGRILDILPQLGWRHAPSQYFLAFRAADRGDLAAAMPHVDALLRQDLYRDRFYPFLRAATAYSDGLTALSRRLAVNPQWRKDYLGDLSGLRPDQFAGHEALLTMLKHSTAPPTTAEVNTYLRRIAQDGDYAGAAMASDRLVGRDRDGNQIRDARFRRFGEGLPLPGPFDWQPVDVAGVTLDVTGEGLQLAANDIARGTVLRQVLTAQPGRYRLMWSATPPGIPDVSWALRCVGGSYLESTPGNTRSSAAATLHDAEVIIPPSGCSTQQLELQFDHRSSAAFKSTIEKVQLVRDERPHP